MVVYVDIGLKKIFPKFLAKQQADFEEIKLALRSVNFPELERLGHRMKGTCGGYGLHGLGELASAIEKAAAAQDSKTILDNIHLIDDYLSTLQVEFK